VGHSGNAGGVYSIGAYSTAYSMGKTTSFR
jgi:hypothetical protein